VSGHSRIDRTTRRRHEHEASENKNRRYSCKLYGTNSLKEGAMLHAYPLLGNRLINKFPLRQNLGKQSVARLRNNRGDCVFYVVRAMPSAGNGPMNSQSDT
jgi:hypothetical protein